MCNKLQRCITVTFEKCFSKWAAFVARRTTIVFIVSLIFFLMLGSGMRNYKTFENEQETFTPEGNPSLLNKYHSEEMFDKSASSRVLSIIATAKSPNATYTPNLLTKAAFEEMIAMEEMMFEKPFEYDDTIVGGSMDETVRPGLGKKMFLRDLCQEYENTDDEDDVLDQVGPTPPVKIGAKCQTTMKPLDFVYLKYNDTYNMTEFADDDALLDRIRTGKGDENIYKGRFNIFVDVIFSGTIPEDVDQVEATGENDIYRAQAAQYTYFMDMARNPDFIDEWYDAWDTSLMQNMEAFSKNTTYVDFTVFSIGGLRDAFRSDIKDDLVLIQTSIFMVATYSILFLGSCSPIHCRCVVGLIGLMCVICAYASGFGVAFMLGWEVAGLHNLMPFLLIGIGVDDMFVVCNALDQTSFNMTPSQRIIQAMKHAGPSITITSFTNALAFYFGSTTSLIALKSFCVFACLCILTLYLSALTIFLAVVVWDTERVAKKKGECCGLCRCKEDHVICCYGFFLSKKQRKFSGLDKKDTKKKVKPFNPNVLKEVKIELEQLDLPAGSPKQVVQIYTEQPNDETKSKTNVNKGGSEGSGSVETRPVETPDQKRKKAEVICELDHSRPEIASKTERFLKDVVAPELLSYNGKIATLFVYTILIVCAIYGATQVRVDFKVDFFISEDAYVWQWSELNKEYFQTGFQATFFVDNQELDYASRETQLQFLEFNENLQRCRKCQEDWSKPNTLQSWYKSFSKWIESKECKHQPGGIKTFQKTIDPEAFYPCLWEFLETDSGNGVDKNLIFTETEDPADRRIIGFKQVVQIKQIDTVAVQGVKYLEDIRKIESTYGLPGTFSYSVEYLDFEQYVVFTPETLISVGLSLVAVFFVILFVTGSLFMTVLVAIAVLLVDLFLMAVIHFWGLTFNSVVVVNVVIAIGLAVDYSAHIAHTYLMIVPSKRCKTDQQKREYKAATALSQMGSSVFHGGFSTFLAIVVLGFSKTYVFEVFFKLWVGIIFFGMSNGFFLLPVIFSYIGPVDMHENHVTDDANENDSVKDASNAGSDPEEGKGNDLI